LHADFSVPQKNKATIFEKVAEMNTSKNSNNERLRELVAGSRLTQPAALALFNRGFGIRGIKESTWKGYFCDPSTTRFRGLSDELVAHAEKVFAPLQK
jgi:predicted DNA-binding transcriptional regulator